MKPKPLVVLKNFTVHVIMCESSFELQRSRVTGISARSVCRIGHVGKNPGTEGHKRPGPKDMLPSMRHLTFCVRPRIYTYSAKPRKARQTPPNYTQTQNEQSLFFAT